MPSDQTGTSVLLHVTATHENAMLSRLAALLGPFDIDHFSYRAMHDGRARAVVGVQGDAWQVDRVASKLGRIVGVLEVQSEGKPLH